MKIKKLVKLVFPSDDVTIDHALEGTSLLRDCLRALDVEDPSSILYRDRLEQVSLLLEKLTEPGLSKPRAKPKTKPTEVTTDPGPSLLDNGDRGSPLT